MRIPSPPSAPILAAAIAGGLVAIGTWAGANAPVRVNWTSSMPRGLYSIDASIADRDAWVAACLPDAIAAIGAERGYLPAGSCPNGRSPVAKQLVALAGDAVEITPDSMSVNGLIRARAPLRDRDSLGRPLHHVAPGTYLVAAGEVWLLGFAPETSWDSRYFGPVPESAIVASIHPLWTYPSVARCKSQRTDNPLMAIASAAR